MSQTIAPNNNVTKHPVNSNNTQVTTVIDPGSMNNDMYAQIEAHVIGNQSKQSNIKPIHPSDLQADRIEHWPTLSQHAGSILPQHMVELYNAVRSTGLPNCLQARIPLKNSLHIGNWEQLLPKDEDGEELLSFLRFGFPMAYQGPGAPQTEVKNHQSAKQYEAHIDDFIQQEKQKGALLGPFTTVPFQKWTHVSPLMTKEKTDPGKRRIITDLSYGESVNKDIVKGTILGAARPHTLPTIDDVARYVSAANGTAYLATIDIQRAYKNFLTDPLDWPLLVISWKDSYYIDQAMPFGARVSSVHMQRIANSIASMLNQQGHNIIVYLDDIIVLGKTQAATQEGYQAALKLLQTLGLPIAEQKLQKPSTYTRWLGIDIDSKNRILIMPQEKITQTITLLTSICKQKSIEKAQLQSLLGRLHHICRCVRPGRLFVSRMLYTLRQMADDRKFTTIGQEMRKDIHWFLTYLPTYNGITLIKPSEPHHQIEADASLKACGAWGMGKYYSVLVPEEMSDAPIAHIEAANVALAVKVFVNNQHAGSTILLNSDNNPTVQVLQSGRGRDPYILAAARDVWFHQAQTDTHIRVEHVPGKQLILADALSRMQGSSTHTQTVNRYVDHYQLKRILLSPRDLLHGYDV